MDHKTDFCPLKGLAEVAKRTFEVVPRAPSSSRKRPGISLRPKPSYCAVFTNFSLSNSPVTTRLLSKSI
jgi:hypothetical protein